MDLPLLKTNHRLLIAASFALLLTIAGCRTMPKATKQEISVRDMWAAQVPEPSRRKIMDEAERHTEWGDKVKIKFEVEHFQKYLTTQQRKARATQPSTLPTTRPSY
jgi:ABC-type uncharacterized transport system auxiliary subunit